MRLVHGLLTLVIAGACTAGGDSGGDPDGGSPPDGNPEAATLFPPAVHSGHDGVHEFRVPVSTDLTNHIDGAVDWSIGDGAIASIEGVEPPSGHPSSRGSWAMITATGSGETSVSGTIGAYTVSSPLLVADYTSEQVQAGETRYHTAGSDDRAACASCHQQAGGADHTPTEMAFHDDAALLSVVTAGRYPDRCLTDEGEECTCDTADCSLVPGYVLSVDHTWNLTEQEADGIVPYLRSLPPSGF